MSATFSVEERSSRNRLILIRTAGRTLTVKYYASSHGHAREIAALQALARRRLAFDVQHIVTQDEGRLVLSSPPSLIPVHERWRSRRPSQRQAAQLGRALASLQTVDPPVAAGWSRLPFDPSRVGLEVGDASAATRQVIRRLQDEDLSDELCSLAARLSGEPRVFCHCDLRTQNVLTATSGSALSLIDWETAGAGPPSLDIGAGLATFVELALTDGRGVPDTGAMLAFLAAWEHLDRTLDLELVLRCAGLRLLQTAVECATVSHEVPDVVDRLCRVGLLLLRRPSEAAIHLRLLA